MQYKTKSKLKSFTQAIMTGIGIFFASEILGNIIGAVIFIVSWGSIDIYLPVPYHFHTIVFILAFIFTTFSFRKTLHLRLERRVVLAVLFVGYFVIFPLVWIFGVSHGNPSLVMLNLSNLPQVLVEANTFVEEEEVLEIPTEFGTYKYRSYFDSRMAEYVYEIWKGDKLVYTESIYSFTRRCLKHTSEICLYVTIPYTVVDVNLETVEVDYECAVITDPERLKDINGDQIIDLVVHVYPGNGKEIYFKIFSLGENLKIEKLPAVEPIFESGDC